MQDDMEFDRNLKAIRKEVSNQTGVILFSPDSYDGKNYDFDLYKHQMSNELLLEFAYKTDRIRQNLIKAASLILESQKQQGLIEVDRAAIINIKLGRTYDRKPKAILNDEPLYGFEKGIRAERSKLFKMKDLTIPKIVEMFNFLNGDNHSISLFCDRFRVSYQLGSRISKLLTKNPDALAELISKMQSK